MKIDIVHATAGEGHRKIAIAVQEAFARSGHRHLQVRLINALDHVSDAFKASYAPFYYWSVRHAPGLWGFSYDLLDNAFVYGLCRPFRSLANSFHCRPLLENILTHQPDVVISTHFLAPEILGRAKLAGKLNAKLFTVITDFFPHTFWQNPGTDLYWVMCDETKDALVRRGVPERIITAGGIPVSTAFKPTGQKKEFRVKHGLEPDRFTLLLTSGSFGLGPQETILEELKAFRDQVQCFVVCANNKELKARLDAASYPFPVKVFGFIDFMAELMEASDLMVAKPGGSTTPESLAKGVCMVVMRPIPGQETRNAKLLRLRNAAFFLNQPAEIRGIMEKALADPGAMSQKRSAIAGLSRPDAADDLVRALLERKS